MNHLSIQSQVDAGLDGIVTHLYVDGQRLVDFKKRSLSVDLNALEQSVRHAGDFYIVTCICGYPSCGRIKQGIQVRHTQRGIGWIVHGFGTTKTFLFAPGEYRAEVRRGIRELKQLMGRHDLDAVPEINKFLYGGKQAPPS